MPMYTLNYRLLLIALCFSSVALLATTSSASSQINSKKTQTELQSLESYLQQERLSSGLRTQNLRLGDVRWTYSEGGAKHKPTVVLLHGLTGNRDHWNGLAQFLTPHYHVIIPDLPNNGDTRVPAHFQMDIPNVTAELRTFIEHLGISEHLHLAGHSSGGSIATQYAAEYPFDTQSLFLLNSAGIYKNAFTSYTKNPDQLKQLIVSRPGDLDDVMQKVMQNPPSIPHALKIAKEKKLIARSKDYSRMVDQLTMLSRLYTPDSFARLTRSVEAPTLILWGKQDKIISADAANELQHLLKRAEQPVLLNNVGHVPMLEAEQLVAQHYLPFLAKTQQLKNPLQDKLIPLN